MGVDTTTAAHHASTNALDDIPADLLGPIPAELRLGSNTLLVQETPPHVGDTVTICARLRIVREGKEQLNTDGDVTHFRTAKVVAAWVKGEPEPPDPEAEQPPLYDDEMEPSAEAMGDDDVPDNVARPDFSDGKS
jgi:hypothetical protein